MGVPARLISTGATASVQTEKKIRNLGGVGEKDTSQAEGVRRKAQSQQRSSCQIQSKLDSQTDIISRKKPISCSNIYY